MSLDDIPATIPRYLHILGPILLPVHLVSFLRYLKLQRLRLLALLVVARLHRVVAIGGLKVDKCI